MSDVLFTLYGCYEYDNTIFDLLELPDEIDKDILIDTLLVNFGEFEPLYVNCSFLKSYIGVWSQKHKKTFEKWVKAYNMTHEPLHNYDRFEESTDTGLSKNVNENKKSAFDSQNYEPDNKTDNSGESEFKHNAHLYGNIGITTSQQMLQAEYDIAEWNIYNHICDIFADELLLCVY